MYQCFVCRCFRYVVGSMPYMGVICVPHPHFGVGGGPTQLTCSRRVLGANTPCNISVINRSTESHRQAFALGFANEIVTGAARRSRRPPQQALGTPPHLRLLKTPPNHHHPDCILRTTPRFSLDQYPRRGKRGLVLLSLLFPSANLCPEAVHPRWTPLAVRRVFLVGGIRQ